MQGLSTALGLNADGEDVPTFEVLKAAAQALRCNVQDDGTVEIVVSTSFISMHTLNLTSQKLIILDHIKFRTTALLRKKKRRNKHMTPLILKEKNRNVNATRRQQILKILRATRRMAVMVTRTTMAAMLTVMSKQIAVTAARKIQKWKKVKTMTRN